MALLKRLIATEPVRLAALLESIVALVAMFTDLIDPAQAAGIIAALVSIHEVIRSIVYAPATVQGLTAAAIDLGRRAGAGRAAEPEPEPCLVCRSLGPCPHKQG